MTDQQSLQPSFQITVNGKLNCFDLTNGGFPTGGGPAHGTLLNAGSGGSGGGGIYELSYGSSTIEYHKGIKVNKLVVYLTNNCPNGWFWTLEDNGSPLIIKTSNWGTGNNILYAFLIDITASDNNGTGILTVTQIG